MSEERPEYNIRDMKQANWRVELFGLGPHGIIVRPDSSAKYPNWFWRKMQYIFFGNEYIVDEEK